MTAKVSSTVLVCHRVLRPILTLARKYLVGLHEKPNGYPSWKAAIKAVMEARARNVRPEDVQERVWKTFETMAFVLMPKINT